MTLLNATADFLREQIAAGDTEKAILAARVLHRLATDFGGPVNLKGDQSQMKECDNCNHPEEWHAPQDSEDPDTGHREFAYVCDQCGCQLPATSKRYLFCTDCLTFPCCCPKRRSTDRR